MGKIYSSQEEYEKAAEEEFRNKVQEVAYYQGDIERTTIDGEWTESELKDDVYTEAKKMLDGQNGKQGLAEKYKHRAMIDRDLLLPEYLSTYICDKYDVIHVYNGLMDRHRNDEKKLFGIHYFDEAVRIEVEKTLKENLISG